MPSDVLGLVALLITGFIAGTLGGLLGIGGCVIIMPVIRFGFDFPPTLMIGTSLAAVVFTSASGAWNNWQMSNVDNNTTFTFATSGVIGIIIGSFVFSSIARYGSLLDLLIGFVLANGIFFQSTFLETRRGGSIICSPGYFHQQPAHCRDRHPS